MSKEIKKFVEEERAAREADRAAYMEEHDMKTFVKWPKGTTVFMLEPVIPRAHQSFGKDVKVFRILIEGEEFDWSINPRSPLYGQIVERLLEAPVELKLNRSGDGLQTRYELI